MIDWNKIICAIIVAICFISFLGLLGFGSYISHKHYDKSSDYEKSRMNGCQDWYIKGLEEKKVSV